jgi:hypothetical protein
MEFNFTQGVLDMKKMIAIALMSGLLASPAWALFESNKQLAVEAEIGKEDGRTVYEIEIVDSNNKTQKVYVDAQSGQAKIDH